MIVLRKGRTTKRLKVPLEQVYRMEVSRGNIREDLIHIPMTVMKEVYSNEPSGRPKYFSLTGKNALYIGPVPDRDYRAHVIGTTMVVL